MFLIITSVTNCDFIISKKLITLVTKCDYSLPIKKNTSDKNGKWSRDKNKILGDRKFFGLEFKFADFLNTETGNMIFI
jgi:hypothetical protein